ncbi:outer membrane beta-barrel protein [Flavihumibacter petaseus]|uniref:Uncharacterized protein n=1 Tax=Flavihumibacter petaseus NBRC 106054 TaxID=1220578 RepID=A0A0E9MWK9_9BACT|nr:outer membrane beta-barrel protein [Flavihumibacter petaseus]GAO41964.1 hypothetical protein FPE01S_01_09770 [Flavihumibacter petaseus NBRC 106054]
MKRLLLPALLFATCLPAIAQKNFVPGYVVKLGGDTLRGEIDNQDWTKNPRKILFRNSGQPVNYGVSDIRTINIQGADHYERHIITRSTRPVNYDEFRIGFVDTLVTDTVFLRQLVAGKWNLYALEMEKKMFFFGVEDEQPVELKYIVTQNDSTLNFYVTNEFREQLKAKQMQFGDENGPDPSRLQYSETSLTKFFIKANGSPNKTAAEPEKEKKKLITFYAGGGAMLNTLTMTSSVDPKLKNMSFDATLRPSIQAGLDFATARSNQRLEMRLEASYFQFASNGKGSTEKSSLATAKDNTYTLRMNNLRLTLSAVYHIIAYPNLRVFIGGGYSMNFSGYPENKMVSYEKDLDKTTVFDPYYDFESTWQQVLVRAGVVINKRYEAGLNYSILGDFSNYSKLEMSPRTLNLQLNYRFRKGQ